MTDKIFVNGIISHEVPDTAPDFILGKFSLNTNELINWLSHNRMLGDENGYIRCTVLRSKSTGKRYVEVDQWKPAPKDDGSAGLPPSVNQGAPTDDGIPL